MANLGRDRFKSTNQEWETPDDLFLHLDAVFHFTRDACASHINTKCESFWTKENTCLDKEWDGVNWVNPAYSNVKAFVKKAYEQRHNCVSVLLVPSRTNTKWWHDWCMKGEIWFICGRPKFGGSLHGLPLPLALVVFGKNVGVMRSFHLKKQDY